MTNDQIKELALANGFKLKEQPDGSMDLNPYVYEFAFELMKQVTLSTADNLVQALQELADDIQNEANDLKDMDIKRLIGSE